MKQSAILLIIIFSISCSTTPKTDQGSSTSLNGTWVPVKEEMGGTPLPGIIFGNQKLTLADSNYTMEAESVDKGVARYNGNKIDIYGKDGVNAGKHFTAIYKLENGELTICYNLTGDAYPETFATTGKPMYFLSTFKKI